MRRAMGCTGRWGMLVALALILPGIARAQDSTEVRNHLYDKLQVTADFTTVLNNSDARVDGSNGDVGTNINFKDILGISGSSIQPAIAAGWKPGRHTELDLGFQFINQTGTRTLNDSIVVGDSTISAGLDAKSTIGSNNANLAFKYSLWAAERHNIGLEIGLGAIFFDLQIDATAQGCVGTACDSGAVNVHKKLTAPTGAVGAFGQWRLGDRWYVGADARGIGGRVDRFNLSIFQGDAYARYYFSNHWGAAAGWFYNDVTVTASPKGGNSPASEVSGKIKFNYSSIRLGAVYAF